MWLVLALRPIVMPLCLAVTQPTGGRLVCWLTMRPAVGRLPANLLLYC